MLRPIYLIWAVLLAGTPSGGPARAEDPVKPPAEASRPSLVLQVGHSAPVSCLAFSPDGKMLATGSEDTTARLWGVATGQIKASMEGHAGEVTALAFSPDGKMLATGSSDRTVRLWGVPSGQLVMTLRGQGGEITSLAFGPDSRWLAVADWGPDATVRIWDLTTGQVTGTVRHGGDYTGKLGLAVSPDGKTLATVGYSQTARLWDVETRTMKAELQGHTGWLIALAFSPDGKTLATGSKDNTARIWDASTGELKATLKGHTGLVYTLAFSPDSKTLATGSFDQTARLWDVQTGQAKATQAHEGAVTTLAFSPDGKLVASGGYDSAVLVWDPTNGRINATLQGHGTVVKAVAFSPDGRTLAAGGKDSAVRLWDPKTGQLRAALQGRNDLVRAIAVSGDGKTLATGSEDALIRLWDLASGQLSATLSGHAGAIRAMAFSPDGRTLATASKDKTARLWDARTGQLRKTLKGHSDEVAALAFSPGGKVLATGSKDKTVRLWDAAGGQMQKTLAGHTDAVAALAFSPDGKLLASGSDDMTARLWDAGTGQLKANPQGHTGRVGALVFSPDGKTLATGSDDNTTRLWDLQTAQLKATLPTAGPVLALGFSADGTLLAIKSLPDVTATRLCDLASGNMTAADSGTEFGAFPPQIATAFSSAGSAISVYDPRDGRVLARLLPLPELAGQTGSGKEWFVSTPEGYFDCSANAAKLIKWNVNGVLYSADQYMGRFRRPDLVQRSLKGEKLEVQGITTQDIPPAAQFIGLKDGDAISGQAMDVTVEATDDQDVKTVKLLVNGRPLPPAQAKPIELSARPIEVGAKDVDPNHRTAKRFVFHTATPSEAQEIRLCAIAYDTSDLSSDPVEIVLKRTGAKPAAGDLCVLSVGVSRYKNADGKGFKNLAFPAIDAKAIADRFKREGPPLYKQVHARVLTDQQATLADVRAGLRWLQESVSAGQSDTVVIFLSGHGVSRDGRYYFAAHDFDTSSVEKTGLPGSELREALGGALQAKAVFLFVDTCHSGGLTGRTDDLAIELGQEVFLLASSGSKEYAYESEEWGHGAFTLALLRALDKNELARDGVIYFNALAYAVPDEVAGLMKSAGRSENEQEPCIPLAARRLRVPLAQPVK